MTIREEMGRRLDQCAMSPDTIKSILDRAEKSPLFKEMIGRWNDPCSDYPPVFSGVIWISMKRVALKYIDEVQPEAWYRGMFT